jgi:hypothetical protein
MLARQENKAAGERPPPARLSTQSVHNSVEIEARPAAIPAAETISTHLVKK